MTFIRPLADSDPTPTKTISQGQFEQGKGGPHRGESFSPSPSQEPSSAQDWLSKRLQMIRALDMESFSSAPCQALSWLVFFRKKMPSNFRFSCCEHLGFLRRERSLRELQGGDHTDWEPSHGGHFNLRENGVLVGGWNLCLLVQHQREYQPHLLPRALLPSQGP